MKQPLKEQMESTNHKFKCLVLKECFVINVDLQQICLLIM
jgi:hypothetical protein